MNKAYYIPTIQEFAKDIEVEQTERFVCPCCEGGSSKEKSLSITRRSSTEAFFNCFRTKCSLGGGHIALYQADDGSVLKSKSRKPTTNQVTHNLTGLDKEVVEYFKTNYYMTPAQLAYGRFRTTFDRRIYMPIFDPNRLNRGGAVRKYKELYQGRREFSSIPKTLNYFTPDSDRVCASWYYRLRSRRKSSDTLLIVEDIVSAIRLTDHVDAVSLMGTALSDDKQKEVRSKHYKKIYLALDEDATLKAIRIKKSCGLYLPNLQVLPLSKDIKDMTPEDIEEKLSECNIV